MLDRLGHLDDTKDHVDGLELSNDLLGRLLGAFHGKSLSQSIQLRILINPGTVSGVHIKMSL